MRSGVQKTVAANASMGRAERARIRVLPRRYEEGMMTWSMTWMAPFEATTSA